MTKNTRIACAMLVSVLTLVLMNKTRAETGSYASVVDQVQPRIVKVFGAGGFRSLESYQSGFLISADGLVLTAWSYVLDTEEASVILNDGRKFTGELVGADPRTEIALLRIDAKELPYFDLSQSVDLLPGSRVLAFSNLYGVATGDEPASVQHGIVSGVTSLAARRGAFETPYRGKVYLLDAMTNNAGAAGGALTDSRGQLAAVLGKELRDAQSGTWLNYAVPANELAAVVEALIAGKPTDNATSEPQRPAQSVDLTRLGVVLIPNILRSTPPFVDRVHPGSVAARQGVRPDDLIVLVDGTAVGSQNTLSDELSMIDALDPVRLTIARGTELIEFELAPR